MIWCTTNLTPLGSCQDCKDAATSFKIIIIMMGCVGNLASTLTAMSRENPDNDYYEKCAGILSCILPIVFNGSVIFGFPKYCNVEGDDHTSELGPGYYCFLCSVVLGNIPSLFVELALPAPPPDEIEAKMENTTDGVEVAAYGAVSNYDKRGNRAYNAV